MDTPTPSAPSVVDEVIRTRRTLRVEVPEAAPTDGGYSRALIKDILAVAGFAPFHHVAPQGSPEPWRCYAFDATGCRRLRAQALDAEVGGRVPRLLGAASALVLVTWTPVGEATPMPHLHFAPSLKNMEHIAAAGAMIQNALLAATARGIPTYWSSGGWLARPDGMEAAGVTEGELVLGAVFFFPEALEGASTSPGKRHASRTAPSTWTRWPDVP